MDIKDKIRNVLKENYGDFDSFLEREYEIKLTNNLLDGSLENKRAWVTYNQVILEVKNSLKDTLKVKEIQYKLTENLNPKEVIIEIIEPMKTFTPELERLYFKIKSFY
jgi:hypothetical protein